MAIPSFVTVNADRSYNLSMASPPWSYFIFQAAGITRGAMDPETQVAGYITRKHVYEIAMIKSKASFIFAHPVFVQKRKCSPFLKLTPTL